MQVHINKDHNIKNSHDYILESANFENIVRGSLGHYQKHITRIEIHFSDTNSAKNGFDDKRCLIHARISGVKPLAAIHQANNIQLALDGAIEKLINSLNHTFGKMKHH